MKSGWLLLVILSVLSSGCVTRHMTVSSASLGPKEVPEGVVTGESTASYLFCVIPGLGDDDSIKQALENATKGDKNKTLVNVYVERKTKIFPLWLGCNRTTRVTGTLVTYKQNP